MAIGAASNTGDGELLAVNVLVAVLALSRGSLEINIDHFLFQVWRFMTVEASCRAVSPEQSELRFRMIKPRKFLP